MVIVRQSSLTVLAARALATVRATANRTMLVNAGSLVGSSVLTSGLGFVYWWLAARLFSPETIGLAAAVISTMTLLGTVGMLGLSTLLIGELPRHRGREGSLIATALVVSAVAGVALGLLFAVGGSRVFAALASLVTSPGTTGLFAIGVGLTALTLVLDQALIGLLRGGLQLVRNGVFSASKLLLLASVPLFLASSEVTATAIWGSWILGFVASLVVLVAIGGRHGLSIRRWLPEWGLLRALGREAIMHHVLNLCLQVPSLTMPLVVTAALSVASTAYFYTASMIAALVAMAPLALSTALYAVGARAPQSAPERLRFTLALSVVLVIGANLVLFVIAEPLMGLFGSAYAEEAAWPLRILSFIVLARIVQDNYVVICRLRGRLLAATAMIAVSSAVELGLAALGGLQGGLSGLALGWLVGAALQAAVMAPTVIRAAFPPPTPRPPLPQAGGGGEPGGTVSPLPRKGEGLGVRAPRAERLGVGAFQRGQP